MQTLRVSFAVLGLVSFAVAGCATSTGDEETAVGEEALTSSVEISCASHDQRYQSCRVESQQGKILDVRLTRQHSSARCTQGVSWGFDEERIWVDQGCRASFRAQVRIGPQTTRTVSCASQSGRPARCATEFEEITSFRLLNQHSQAPCVQGTSFGHDLDSVWVDQGCRATFEVRGFLRTPPSTAPAQNVTLHTFSDCDAFFTIATLTAETDCRAITRSPGSVKKDGVCFRLPVGMSGEAACREHKPRPAAGTTSFFRSAGCSSFLGSASSRQECETFSSLETVRSILQEGRCRDVAPTDAERACLRYAP